MLKLIKFIREEVAETLPAVVYFWVAFSLIYFTSGLALYPGEPRQYSYTTVCLGSLLMGKVLIITNHLSFINAFPHRPRIYNISWKIFVYYTFTFLFWILETLADLLYHHHQWSLAWAIFKPMLISTVIWSTHLWVLWVLIIFVTFNEFIHVIGKREVELILFGRANNESSS